MNGDDLPPQQLHGRLAESFRSPIEKGTVDLVLDPENDTCELQADAWTLHIAGWPINLAFVALDDDPATDGERIRTLTATLGPQIIRSLKDADDHLEGVLSAVLLASKDALSISLGSLVQGSDIA